MNLKRTEIFIMLLACTLACASSAYSEASEKGSVLQICNQLFRAPVDAEQNLFEVNKFYVLRVKFDNRGKLEELAVEPKYFFEESHPEWEEPDDFTHLSQSEFDSLLMRLDAVKPKGALIKPDSISPAVTNMTAWHTAIYEYAELKWGEVVDLRRGESAPLAVRWIKLNYLRPRSA